MDPEEITRLAEIERQKKSKLAISKEKSFNPLDWMDFRNTRKWMKKNLALSDAFYSTLIGMIICAGLVTWFYIQDGEKWTCYLMIGLWPLVVATCIGGFIYGYLNGRKKINAGTDK
jgi:hypothetical protein